MESLNYGKEPDSLGIFNCECKEMLFYMYLPVKLKRGSIFNIRRLRWADPLLNTAIEDFLEEYGFDELYNRYVYITAKHLYVTPNNMANRPGWHSDGFLTEDVNYIWTNKFPTEFCIQDFDLSDNHEDSLREMEEQVKEENIVTYRKNELLKLTTEPIHRVPVVSEEGMRTFVKISFSKNKFNLEGNSHNYILDYDWEMYDRGEVRNTENGDSFNPEK